MNREYKMMEYTKVATALKGKTDTISIAKEVQGQQGSFSIYDLLSILVFLDQKNDLRRLEIIDEIEEWLLTHPKIKFIGSNEYQMEYYKFE